jgi:hypothetical protein
VCADSGKSAGGAGTRAQRTIRNAALSSRALPDEPAILAEEILPDRLTTN